MRFLVDECLHTSLVDVIAASGHEAHHVNWLGLSCTSDRALMTRIRDDNYTFVTNNAQDFRKLFARSEIHAGLVIIVPQLPPAGQRALLKTWLQSHSAYDDLVNIVIEISIEEGQILVIRYALPPG